MPLLRPKFRLTFPEYEYAEWVLLREIKSMRNDNEGKDTVSSEENVYQNNHGIYNDNNIANDTGDYYESDKDNDEYEDTNGYKYADDENSNNESIFFRSSTRN